MGHGEWTKGSWLNISFPCPEPKEEVLLHGPVLALGDTGVCLDYRDRQCQLFSSSGEDANWDSLRPPVRGGESIPQMTSRDG